MSESPESVHRRRGPSIGRFLLVGATGLALACAPSDAALVERHREVEVVARSLMAAWERADQQLLEELFWPQATYDDFPNQHTHQGLAEIVAYVDAMHAWADDVYMNVGDVHVTADGAVIEWVFSAIQARPMGAVTVGTGAEVVTNGVTIIEMDGDRIIRAADYADTTPLLLQVGGRIELPGGEVMEMDGR